MNSCLSLEEGPICVIACVRFHRLTFFSDLWKPDVNYMYGCRRKNAAIGLSVTKTKNKMKQL